MNLIWHIVKKDLRCFGIPIALMFAILVIKATLLYFTPLTDMTVPITSFYALTLISNLAGDNYQILGSWLSLFCGLDTLILLALVPVILYEDPSIGEKTFWRARPIAAGQMLAAKALVIFLVAWPLQTVLQIFVNLHYAALTPALHETVMQRHWYDALGETAINQAWIVSLVAIIPLLWQNFIVGSVVLLGFYICLLILSTMTNELFRPIKPPSLEDRFDLLLGIWLFTVVGTAVWMYSRRKQPIGFFIFLAGLSAIYLVSVA